MTLTLNTAGVEGLHQAANLSVLAAFLAQERLPTANAWVLSLVAVESCAGFVADQVRPPSLTLPLLCVFYYIVSESSILSCRHPGFVEHVGTWQGFGPCNAHSAALLCRVSGACIKTAWRPTEAAHLKHATACSKLCRTASASSTRMWRET